MAKRWTTLFLGALFSPGVGFAQCESAVPTDEVLSWMGQIEEGLRTGDEATVGRTAIAAEKTLPCLAEPLPSAIAARAYRALGAGLYLAGSTQRGKMWMLTSAEMDPMFEYAMNDLPEGHELEDVWLDQVDLTGDSRKNLIGKHFVEGAITLDGSSLKVPMAHEGRMHLIQLSSDNDIRGWIMEGVEFPEELFDASTPSAGKSKEPKGEGKTAKKKTSKGKPVKTTPLVSNWPTERVALFAGGGAAVVGSGVLYALSGMANKRAHDVRFKTELDKEVKANRTLVISSAAVAAAGAGSLGFGVLFYVIDGQPVTGFNIRF